MPEDFNNVEDSDVIPEGKIAMVQLTVKPGGAGDDGWLRRAKDGNSEGLDCEFTVLDGPYAKRKFWTLFTLSGTTENHAEAGRMSRRILRAILDSAHGFKHSDASEEAKKVRTTENYGAFNGLRFMARIGVRAPKDGYRAQNRLDGAISAGSADWHKIEQLPLEQRSATAAAPTKTATTAAPANAIDRPKWAHTPQQPTQSTT
jgi:hypothetical protein